MLCTASLQLHPQGIDVRVPVELCGGEIISNESLKEWVWLHCKDEILPHLQLHVVSDPQRPDPVALPAQDDDDDDNDGHGNSIATVQQSALNDDDGDGNYCIATVEQHALLIRPTCNPVVKDPVRKSLDLLTTIVKVHRKFFDSESSNITFGYFLEALLDIMDSEYGFIGEIKYEDDGTMYLQTRAVTNIAWNDETQKFYEENVEQGLRFCNLKTLFGTVMTTGKPVISNNPSIDPRAGGIPAGHPPLNHFLGIPFFKSNGEMNGMVGLSNRPGGYSEEDIAFLEPVTVMCANLFQIYLQMEQNHYLINSLEQSVKARTSELEQANADLEEANRRLREASEQQLEHFACMSHEIRTPLNCIIGKLLCHYTKSKHRAIYTTLWSRILLLVPHLARNGLSATGLQPDVDAGRMDPDDSYKW
jgi:GAF domain-containing protein